MRFILAIMLFSSAPAFAWNIGSLAYMNPPPQYQQPAPQESYSEQYNRGYMDAYLTAHGSPQSTGYGGAYQQGQNDAYQSARRGY